MVSLKTCLLGAVSALLFATTSAAPSALERRDDDSKYWVHTIKRQGTVAFGSSDYQIYRDVTTYGADSTGQTDSTDAINRAISDGGRCGLGCDSSTITPAIVYFPPGTYLVSKPIVQYYYTQLVGDATKLPVLKAAPSFTGMAVIDADPYEPGGANWYTNQNNFFRQVRNFVIDLTSMPQTAGAGIHWQVAQATSLQNIRFEMISGSASKQIGIFMDNGSGGFMSDLTFNGGQYGAFFGNQQFTSRNMTFNGCQTAIFMNWNWGWTLQDLKINNCEIGLDMSNSPASQTVGSVVLLDSTISASVAGVLTAFVKDPASVPSAGGTLIIDNVNFSGSKVAVKTVSSSDTTILAGGSTVRSWGQGKRYNSWTARRIQQTLTAPTKPSSLLNSAGRFYTRSKPQYEDGAASVFISVKDRGAKGDGITDDTAAIQKAIDAVGNTYGVTSNLRKILYFDHGAYLVTSTIKIPKNIRITGEIWPLIMATGSYFSNPNSPKPVFQVGVAGQKGNVEITDLMFETKGAAPGAIMMEWNIISPQGGSGMWDTHFRIGGSAGTGLQSNTCAKNPSTAHGANAACEGAFLLFHATKASSGVYLENTWFWVADHELDLSDHGQIDIYNGRGVLIESAGPAWLWGTSSEHSVLYNYQVNGAKAVFMGMIQSETPYFQSNPVAPTPFTPQTAYSDPDFGSCKTQNIWAPCYKSWGLRIVDSSNVFVYGTGLYSFFDNYSQDCVATQKCQQNVISVEGSITNVNLYAVNTKASIFMVTLDGVGTAHDSDNRSNFCATLALWTK